MQALYQIELAGAPAERVIKEFAENGMREVEDEPLRDVDPGLFGDVVRGVSKRCDEIDHRIGEALTPEWPLYRLETV
ncbi:MAG: transcription antitermination factor NusB, partial [Stellaceae bacterium]